MKRYSDLMKNGIIECDKECDFNIDGKCCHFASSNERDMDNDVCEGRVRNRKTEPLHIGFFRADFSDISTEDLKAYASMFDSLQFCVDIHSPNVVDVWKVLSRMWGLVRSELSNREQAAYSKKRAREKRVQKGLPIPKVHKKVIRPLKAKR